MKYVILKFLNFCFLYFPKQNFYIFMKSCYIIINPHYICEAFTLLLTLSTIYFQGAGPLQSSGGTGGGGLLMTVLAPVMALWGFICSFLFGQPQNPGGAYNPTAPEAAAQPSTASKPTEPKEQQRPGTSRQRPKS